MSTYLNPSKPNATQDFSDCPDSAKEFLNYLLTIRSLSPRTVNAYYIDLRTFFKFLVQHQELVSAETPFEKIPIAHLDLAFIQHIRKKDIYDYLYYVTRERANSAATRSRKLSSLKGYFKYLTNKAGVLQNNPVEDIEMPAQKKRLPKYLSLDESTDLLKNIQSDFYERDYCILTLFLNCGMRLSELVGLNISDLKADSLRVVGKGNKERIIYLNGACIASLQNMLHARAKCEKIKDDKALFISAHTGKRLSARRVQQIVEKCFAAAGLDGKGYSVHKLRHTAATLFYRHGHIDLLTLKEILGHTNVATTEIYTHLDSAHLKEAAEASPLAHIQSERPVED